MSTDDEVSIPPPQTAEEERLLKSLAKLSPEKKRQLLEKWGLKSVIIDLDQVAPEEEEPK